MLLGGIVLAQAILLISTERGPFVVCLCDIFVHPA